MKILTLMTVLTIALAAGARADSCCPAPGDSTAVHAGEENAAHDGHEGLLGLVDDSAQSRHLPFHEETGDLPAHWKEGWHA